MPEAELERETRVELATRLLPKQTGLLMANLVPTMTQRQATGRDSSTIGVSVQGLLLLRPLKLPELDQVFEAAGEVRRAAPGEVPMNRLNARLNAASDW